MGRFKIYIILQLIGFPLLSQTQSSSEGVVSFIASDNVYVRFSSTDVISIGDTLYFKSIPCLEVIKKSSTSCICQSLNDCNIEKDNILIFKEPEFKKESKASIGSVDSTDIKLPSEEIKPEYNTVIEDDHLPEFKQRLNARTSIATYSSFSPFENNDRHRLVGRVSMNIDNLNDSRFSVQSYLNYRQNLQSTASTSSSNNQLLRIYNLAISYDIDSTMQLSFGRRINRNLSSIGVIDGAQFEKQFNSFITGAVVGFRPDFEDFGFNPNLFEYGAFIGNQFSNESIYSRTTLGFMEQRNAGYIDRRYLHLQNIQTINGKIHVFGSMEFDLFSSINDVSSYKPRLTNLYLSTRYRFNRKISLTLSYDNRKRIIFYETFRTEVERLLEDDFARQGIRMRVSLRPMNRIFAGASFAKRFQSNSENNSENLNAFVTLNRFPIKDGTLSLRYNRNESNYLRSNIYSTTYSFYSFKNKLNTQLYFRNVQYNYFTSENKSMQNYYGANLYLRITRSLRLGLLFELSDRQDNRYYRINTKLIKRFNRK